MKSYTQYQKIITWMLRKKEIEWFYPYDFMREIPNELFVGYEASARLSELTSLYPEMIIAERRGKYIVRKLRLDNIDNFINRLPRELRNIFDAEHYRQTRLI